MYVRNTLHFKHCSKKGFVTCFLVILAMHAIVGGSCAVGF